MRENFLKKYDVVYSLGTNCAASDYLRRMGLRKEAGPFDWVAAGAPNLPFDFLIHGFENFLRQEDLVLMEDLSAANLRQVYRSFKSSYTFYHDFSKDKTLSEQFEEVFEK